MHSITTVDAKWNSLRNKNIIYLFKSRKADQTLSIKYFKTFGISLKLHKQVIFVKEYLRTKYHKNVYFYYLSLYPHEKRENDQFNSQYLLVCKSKNVKTHPKLDAWI